MVWMQYQISTSEAKQSVTRRADSCESEPWQAFLVQSVPNWARIEEGALILATSVLVGPGKENEKEILNPFKATSFKSFLCTQRSNL